MTFKAACIQMNSGRDIQTNIDTALGMITQAAKNGAVYIQTPEMTNLLELDRRSLFSKIDFQETDAGLKQFQTIAEKLEIWLHIGSIALKISENKATNRGFLISPQGQIVSHYDKIHMFDVDLPNGESYRESNTYQPGSNAVVAQTDIANFGMGICYDLRFPHLFREQAKAGASIITAPAAFTKTTGEAHWQILLRSRAIETGCWMISAAQTGLHEDGRKTYGHSLIVNPWGEIISEADQETGIIYGDIDLGQVDVARSRIAALKHDLPFDMSIKSHA